MNQTPPSFEENEHNQPQRAAPQPLYRADAPSGGPSRPWLTYTILGVTAVVFVLQQITQFSGENIDIPALYGMKINELILLGQWWRLLTPVLLHGSIIHVGFNMYALLNFGPFLEEQFGRARFLALYLLSAFAGNVISFAFTPAPSLGSSTAIFGLLAAQGVYLYQNREFFGAGARRALNSIVMVALVNFLIGLSPGIDNWGHLGGLVGGALFTFIGGPVLSHDGEERPALLAVIAGVIVFVVFAALAGWLIVVRS